MEMRLPECSFEIHLFLLQLNVFLRPHVRGKAHAKQTMALASVLVTSLETIVAHVKTHSLEPIVTVSIMVK